MALKVKAKKVTVRAKSPPPCEAQLSLPFAEADRSSPAEYVRSLARGFRLRFHRFGQERRVDDATKAEMLEGNDVDLAQMRLTKKLFDRHPAVRALTSAEGTIRKYFEAKTLPFPEAGVRILVLDPPINAADLSIESLDSYYGTLVGSFREDLQAVIQQHHGTAVQQLQAVWGDVLQKAQQKLRSQFDPAQYPTAEQLSYRCRCVFESYNVELSKDWKYLSPAERERELRIVQQKFEAAVASQEEFVVGLLDDSITQLIGSLSNFQEGATRSFKSSTVERVFNALDEFKQKTVKYGILKDSAVEQVFSKLRRVMQPPGTVRGQITAGLRSSEDFRQDMIAKVQSVGQQLQQLLQSGQVRRKLLRDQ